MSEKELVDLLGEELAQAERVGGEEKEACSD